MSSLSESVASQLTERMAALDWQGQPEWLSTLRQDGAEQLRRHGLPTRRVERWKYTSLQALEQRLPQLAAAPGGDRPIEAPEPLVEAPVRVLMQDGGCGDTTGELPAGLSMMSLEQALLAGHPRLQEMLQALDIADSAAGFAALNTATLRNGLLLHVAAGVDAGEVLLQWVATPGSSGLMSNARVCVLLEQGARLGLVEQFESSGRHESQLNLVLQVQLEARAHLRHTRLQQESGLGILITRTETSQEAGSEYLYTGLDFGGALVRHDVRSRLLDVGAFCSLNGASLTRGNAHVDNHLDSEHLAPECRSSQVFRAVLGDRSRVVFNGRVYVASGADGTDAHQSSAALLLSPLAEIDAKPELEIYADEVVASHGATVGQLDENQLFYLQSRGLDVQAARNMMTTAFCRSVIDPLPGEALRNALAQRLQSCLGAAGVAHE